jgi:hypothetical protein
MRSRQGKGWGERRGEGAERAARGRAARWSEGGGEWRRGGVAGGAKKDAKVSAKPKHRLRRSQQRSLVRQPAAQSMRSGCEAQSAARREGCAKVGAKHRAQTGRSPYARQQRSPSGVSDQLPCPWPPTERRGGWGDERGEGEERGPGAGGLGARAGTKGWEGGQGRRWGAKGLPRCAKGLRRCAKAGAIARAGGQVGESWVGRR